MSSKYSHYFTSDPEWERYSNDPSQPELALKTEADPNQQLNIARDRKADEVKETDWVKEHPPESYGYIAYEENVEMRDGHQIPVKIYHPKASTSQFLPLLFVTHGGGWVQGTPITEEIWLLFPIFQNFDFVVVSVDYRLAPEHVYPTYVNDCWDTFQWTLSKAGTLRVNIAEIYLAGSSAGGCLAAVMAQKARDAKIPIKGVVANVPVTCHPKHFPRDNYEYTSYDQCVGTMLNATEMYQMWDVVFPDSSRGSEPEASPLLGAVDGLPPHLVFVAGQDPLRDDGLAYAEKLAAAGVKVKRYIYPGVPHMFTTIRELGVTKRFQSDLVDGVRELLR